MLTYTNQLKQLVLPEYGRNIQNMVDHCVTIADRDERNRCAHTIVAAMLALFPPTGGDPAEYRRKLWDHLIIMSGFELDIDLPFEHVDREVFADLPDTMPVAKPSDFKMRHYGANIPRMVDIAVAMEPGEERDALIYLIADHMKKAMVAFNREQVDDKRVFSDLRIMSHGAINLDPEQVRLHDFKAAPAPAKKKKKR